MAYSYKKQQTQPSYSNYVGLKNLTTFEKYNYFYSVYTNHVLYHLKHLK